jgi:hypothetical protein
MATNRNAPCPCGSGLKYKKCCLASDLKNNIQNRVSKSTITDKAEPLACTTTGEIFQPTRVHYKVNEPELLTAEFSKIKCLKYDPYQKRFGWLYDEEAKDLKFKNKPSDPENSVVLGEFISKNDNEVVLNTRSIERAIQGLLLFDELISKGIIQVADITIVNKLFSVKEALSLRKLDDFFDESKTTVRGPQELDEKMAEIKANAKDKSEEMRLIFEYIEKSSREPEPEIERFPCHYVTDGILSVESALQIRQKIAMEHWLGNTHFTMKDAIDKMVK